MSKLKSKLNLKSGYTLIELSIVISIIAVLMTGAAGIAISVANHSKKESSKVKIEQIYRAIGKFLLVNKRLPCPASLILTNDDVNYGVEVGNGSGCSGSGVYQSPSSTQIFYGMVPVKTLGLALENGNDDFGSKISYIIDQRFTRNFQEVINFSNPSFGTVDAYNSSMIVRENPSSISRDITDHAIMILISHGLNKAGAFNFNATVQNTRSIDSYETSNDYSASFDNVFISLATNSDAFDDIVFFKTRNQIVEDFNVYHFIACNNAGANYGGKSAYYGQKIYATASCASLSYNKIAEKHCDKFGNWHEVNKCENW